VLIRSSRRARWIGVGVLAFAVRVGYVLGTAPRRLPFTDSLWYQLEANYLAKGHGFVGPVILAVTGRSVPSAAHPPLFPLLLAAGSLLGATTVQAHQVIGCTVGVGTVLGVGLVASEVAGERAGLMAAVLAALYPPLWLNDGGLMAEGLFALITTGVIWTGYRLARGPSVPAAAALGLSIGLAILTRAEAVLLLVVLVVPLVARARAVGARTRAKLVGVVVLTVIVVVSPWVVRNLVTFERPVTLSTGDSSLAGANCDPAYYGPGTGLWIVSSSRCYAPPPPGDESVLTATERRHGLEYAARHVARLPVVAAVRIARVWQLYGPLQDADVAADDGRPKWGNRVGLAAYVIMVPLAVAGGLVLHGRRVSLLPLVAQVASVSLTAALVWGAIRFRAPAEVVLMVLAGVALDAVRPRAGHLVPSAVGPLVLGTPCLRH
jgi:Dolichyl-phosphate-mannose-protein mannosyltransferase